MLAVTDHDAIVLNAGVGPMKKLLLAIATLTVAAVPSAPVMAQNMSEWGMWDAPRRYRQRPPDVVRPQHDDTFSDDEYFEVPPSRVNRARRYQQRWGNDDDRDDDWYDRRDPRAGEFGDDFEDDDSNDRADQDADNRGADGKPIGVTGGARPFIAPVQPPLVAFSAKYPVGSIVIDTGARKLYFVRGHMSAFAYPIGVGRDGFSWNGTQKVSRIAEWPDWYPPAEMRQRKPELPERMLGGVTNPLGAKAIYLGNTLYRIHGTNDPKSIGRAESSGCFRMLNQHVLHLATLVQVGTDVTVVRSLGAGPGSVAAVNPTVEPAPRSNVQPPNRARVQWSADPDPRPYVPQDYR